MQSTTKFVPSLAEGYRLKSFQVTIKTNLFGRAYRFNPDFASHGRWFLTVSLITGVPCLTLSRRVLLTVEC